MVNILSVPCVMCTKRPADGEYIVACTFPSWCKNVAHNVSATWNWLWWASAAIYLQRGQLHLSLQLHTNVCIKLTPFSSSLFFQSISVALLWWVTHLHSYKLGCVESLCSQQFLLFVQHSVVSVSLSLLYIFLYCTSYTYYVCQVLCNWVSLAFIALCYVCSI